MDFPFVKEAVTKLFSKPSTVLYPVVPSEAAPNYRGRIIFHPENCINCNMCERVCAGQAISHTSEPCEEGERITRRFYLGSCTFCSHCASFCTHGAIELSRDYHMVADYYHAATFEEGEEALIVSGTYIKKAPVKKAPPPKPAPVKEAPKLEEKPAEAAPVQTEAPKAEVAAPAAVPVPEPEQKPAEEPVKAEAPVELKPRDDGKPVQDPSKCIYCTLCARNCPAGALNVDRKAKTWTLDEDLCVACGTCQGACPKDAIIM
ncbi:MAG: 4Fe-4S binding protein [Oscillospiraceae bacterium]|nr:4Fe-4S binding protein [Oscillospiraceae bacterium]